MKKFLGMLGLMFVLLTGSIASAQDVNYNRVDVYNAAGVNTVDYIFSYDNHNTCMNNFKVINNTGYQVSFNFEIRMAGYWMYSGVVTIGPYRSVYFNNAFTNCNSSRQLCTIRTW